MNKIQSLLFALLITCFSSVETQAANYNTCEPPSFNTCKPLCFNPCSFAIRADYLYWKPCANYLDYAAVIEGTAPFISAGKNTSKYRSICPQWLIGFRVSLGAAPESNQIGWKASYTYLPSKSKGSTTRDFVSILTMHPFSPMTAMTVKSKWDVDYHEADLLLTYESSCNPCHSIVSSGGLVGIHLKQKVFTSTLPETPPTPELNIYDATDSSKWNSEYCGIGIRVGSEYQYNFSDCVGFFVKGQYSLLSGKGNSKLTETYTDTISWSLKDKDQWNCANGVNVGAGIVFESNNCSGFSFALRVGYEIHQWYHLPSIRIFPDTPDPAADNSLHHSTSALNGEFGHQGLVVGLSIGF